MHMATSLECARPDNAERAFVRHILAQALLSCQAAHRARGRRRAGKRAASSCAVPGS